MMNLEVDQCNELVAGTKLKLSSLSKEFPGDLKIKHGFC